jgi:hypothetical protein
MSVLSEPCANRHCEGECAECRLRAIGRELLTALKALMQDERFQVAIGGNPHAVAELVAQANAAIASAEAK